MEGQALLGKIKDNLGLIATAIALMGSVGAGLSTATDIVNTLQGIDDRMVGIEIEFEQLKQDTMVSNDIAVLYEKIQSLEEQAMRYQELDQTLASMSTEIYQIKEDLRDSGMDFSNKKLLEEWEWSDAQAQIIRIDTILQQVQNQLWNLDSLETRIAYLEANLHGH
nr:putative adhesin-like protein [uncultured Mediterranean phage uvMED]BAR25903.1 putative adhesin-like protein [uncultured Mediterranean phage uvMED]